ncbi:MAG: hypothetical protein R6X27_13305, partial [Candidatus Desulfacyla sp.]
YIWAGGFSALLHDKMGLQGDVMVTGGPIHNARFVHEGKLDFGLVTAGPAWEGFYGQGWTKGRLLMGPIEAIACNQRPIPYLFGCA